MTTPVEKGQSMTRHAKAHPVGFVVSHEHIGAQVPVLGSVLHCMVATTMASAHFCPIILHVTPEVAYSKPLERGYS